MGCEKTVIKKLLYVISLSLMTSLVLTIFPEQIMAQPGLPEAPEQTPIDGGLGILAALGGAYAIKKIREKD